MHVWVGDRLVAAEDARVSVFDRAFHSGEGVFETVRAYGRHPFRLDAHLDRLERGAADLGFAPPPRELLHRAVDETAAANAGDGDLALRLTVTPGTIDPRSTFPGRPSGGPTLVVTAQRLDIDPSIYERGVAAVTVERTRELPHVKAVSYLAASLARREAAARGAEEAVLVSPAGIVLEGSYSNLFARVRGELVTPPAEAAILAGVTRAVVLELAASLGIAAAERPLTVEGLRGAEEAFLTASTRELVPLVLLDGEPVGDGVPGPTTRELLRAYRDEVSREVAAG